MAAHPSTLTSASAFKEHLRHDFFPASAFRGPWINLLTHHPRRGLDFLIQVFNHSAGWYAHPRLHDPLEPARKSSYVWANGTTRKQWVNPRLWGLYRGMSVGPYSLQSLLMAFESGCSTTPNPARRARRGVARNSQRSDSAALSRCRCVATVHPHQSGEALLVLLSVQDYIEIDRSRMVGEHQTSSLTGLSDLRAKTKIYKMSGRSRMRWRTASTTLRLPSQTCNWAPWLHGSTSSSTVISPHCLPWTSATSGTSNGSLPFIGWTCGSTAWPMPSQQRTIHRRRTARRLRRTTSSSNPSLRLPKFSNSLTKARRA